MKIVLASSNAGKLAELHDLLADTGIELVSKRDFDIPDPDETGTTFVENAIIKARHAAAASGLPALADDSGICVDALGGAPGLDSAIYAGIHGADEANNDKLLCALADVPDEQRTAHYTCVMVLLRSAVDPDPVIATGRWPGRILHARRGSNGFGYDPLFLPDDGGGLSSGELEPAVKNRISHRGLALAALRQMLLSPSPACGRGLA
ncbi:MAG: Nucleoside 5-triphosphatase RdgB (dHAPTP, dITP, XTP-specific) [Rhodanobacteraceae bacterium]|nr:MAG: Nucleoside 5-triphosphatase RdgB (dHAPTP, dITP, XTP-specific) [Rhodanobacteraceae bacterium]